MTSDRYVAAVTDCIIKLTGGNFEFPESFEIDVLLCMNRRLSPEQAAEEILADEKTVRTCSAFNLNDPVDRAVFADLLEEEGWVAEAARVREGRPYELVE